MNRYVLSLDLSTKSGYAVYRDGELLCSGTAWPDKKKEDFGSYPGNYVRWADYLSENLAKKAGEHVKICGLVSLASHEVTVVIEETTASQNNYSQKILEFLHFLVVKHLSDLGVDIVYLRDGTWKTITDARQNKEERNFNAKIARIKKKLKAETGKKRVLAKIDGKVTGKLTKYDYYIRAANEMFGLRLTDDDDNEAAAILLGKAYLMGAIACDGTVKGGTLKKSEATDG